MKKFDRRSLLRMFVGAPLAALAAETVAENAAAYVIPFGTLPDHLYIRGPRYRVVLKRQLYPQSAPQT
jgi:hypothetical protein